MEIATNHDLEAKIQSYGDPPNYAEKIAQAARSVNADDLVIKYVEKYGVEGLYAIGGRIIDCYRYSEQGKLRPLIEALIKYEPPLAKKVGEGLRVHSDEVSTSNFMARPETINAVAKFGAKTNFAYALACFAGGNGVRAAKEAIEIVASEKVAKIIRESPRSGESFAFNSLLLALLTKDPDAFLALPELVDQIDDFYINGQDKIADYKKQPGFKEFEETAEILKSRDKTLAFTLLVNGPRFCCGWYGPGKYNASFLEAVKTLAERDNGIITAKTLVKVAPSLIELFGDKSKAILKYIVRRNDRESLYRIDALNGDGLSTKSQTIAGVVDNIKIIGELGNKQADRLIKLASYVGGVCDLDLDSELEAEITEDLHTCYTNMENLVKNYFAKVGISDINKGIKFNKWVASGDETALQVLRGEKIVKEGIAKSYEIEGAFEFNLDEIKNDLQTYASMAGLNTIVEKSEDLMYYKDIAAKIMSQLEEKPTSQDVLAEVKPNLNKILNLAHKATGIYTLSVDPSNLESQMEALQRVTSCLSPPDGQFFKYTQEYMKNPNTFWAVIGDGRDIVGRITILVGKDSKGNKALARVSGVYSVAAVKESSCDSALKKYAAEIGARYITRGQLTVPGLTKFYDDFIGEGEGEVVTVKSKTSDYSRGHSVEQLAETAT
jgi:hypothetical protein